MPRLNSVEDLINWRTQIIDKEDTDEVSISVCCGTGCSSVGANELVGELKSAASARGNGIKIRSTGCHGFCERGPLVVINPEKTFYNRVKPAAVSQILDAIENKEVIPEFLYHDPQTGEAVKQEHDVGFYKKQQRLVLANNGIIDPRIIEDYIAHNGYLGLAKALYEMTPDEVISVIKDSKLRGRGGAGFTAGIKWEFTRRSPAKPKYVVCNADEGDPGAFMDRSILEGNPHNVIEGMIIAAYAIGSQEGYIYCRAEYPLAIANLQIAIKQARECGLLGENILGTDFSFDLHIKEGAGAFVCGEETALIASIEGKRGEPQPRPPFPAVKGLWNKPTNVNNVKTYAMVPYIILNGADWFTKIGTENSPGTAVFALTGKINNTGLIEVPMGITLREIIYEIGGGIPNGKKFKAVQTGGPLGGCLPAEALDTPVDFDSLVEAGATMGSGGMIVVDEDTCMVEFARYFLTFASAESCGKCVPCRIGGHRLLEVIDRICDGEGKLEDLDEIENISRNMKEASLCALGQLTPGPVMASLRFFRDEYLAHIVDKKCPAKVCKGLITYSVIAEKCTGCMVCARNCPAGAITGEKRQVHVINTEICERCGICIEVCKFDAILVE
ncbi:MAG: NADH-ubiquinone oxidoreductase-F iron-sulfur binding region domain-containing protein [Chloroflexota bacterium]